MASIRRVSKPKLEIKRPSIPPFGKKGHIEKIKSHEMIRHETKRKALVKFLLVLAVVLFYWAFISFRYGKIIGAHVTLLTWSLFVMCSPIATAGLLIDLPARLLTKIRMFYIEIIVWVFALLVNLFTLATYPSIYDKTILLSILRFILTNPVPYWSIIFVSVAGTFVSVRFMDELLDVSHEKHRKYYLMHESKHTLITFAFVILFLVLFYNFMVQFFGFGLTVF